MSDSKLAATVIRPATLNIPQEWVLAAAIRAMHNIDKTTLPAPAKDLIKNSLKIDPDGIKFLPGGKIFFDGSLRRQALIFRPGTDLKIQIGVSRVDMQTIRVRLDSATTGAPAFLDAIISKVSGGKKVRDIRETLLLGITETFYSTPALWPYVKFVDTDKDEYFDITLPVDWAPIAHISTDNGELSIGAHVPVIEAILELLMNQKVAALENTPDNKTSMAATWEANQIKESNPDYTPRTNKTPANEQSTAVSVPDIEPGTTLHIPV